jgi:murein DD-endopeptidase MepM/ murein hydrolase activator NlpD
VRTPADPDDETPRSESGEPRLSGYTGLPNPAIGQRLAGTYDDPLAAFSHRPLDEYIIPEGGLFLDPLHDGPHYGIDYANPADYLNGRITFVSPIGPGYVTTRSTCVACFVDGDMWGRVTERWPQYNFGFGTLVVVETPYNSDVSIYVMYAHLSRDLVGLGDYVTPDDVLGVVGSTGYSEEAHLHMEIRYGTPGLFWNTDFSDWSTMDRWLATMYVNPAWLVFPEYHVVFVRALDEWVGLKPQAPSIP